MVRESGLFKMLEFDLWMFFFAIFQLILTNVIIFKLVSIIYSIYTPNTLKICLTELQVHGSRSYRILYNYAISSHPLQG